MKHSTRITVLLVSIFVLTQLFGLSTVAKYIHVAEDVETGEINITHPGTAMGEPLQVENKDTSFIYIVVGVLIGTLVILALIKFNIGAVWKYWFLLAVFIAISVALGVYVSPWLAYVGAAVLAIWKIYRPNVYVHNLSEILIYTGIAILFISALNLVSAIALLLLISLYDMYAVWKSKHMVKMAKFQSDSNVFAGLFIPYKKGKVVPKKKGGKKVKSAILGGGDVAFPLLFSAATMEWLITSFRIPKGEALALMLIIVATTTAALSLLLWKSEKDKFYPAMPFISAGCFIGLGIVWVVTMFI